MLVFYGSKRVHNNDIFISKCILDLSGYILEIKITARSDSLSGAHLIRIPIKLAAGSDSLSNYQPDPDPYQAPTGSGSLSNYQPDQTPYRTTSRIRIPIRRHWIRIPIKLPAVSDYLSGANWIRIPIKLPAGSESLSNYQPDPDPY